MPRHLQTIAVQCGLALLSVPFASPAQPQSEFIPNLRPRLSVSRASGPVRIDGHLDDAGWRGAARALNFSETYPGDQVRPPVDTEVAVTYSDTHLFIAFTAHDDAATLRSSLRDRDQIFDDDYVGVLLDTYGNSSWAYKLCVNPRGVQGDMRWTPAGEDIGFDVVFESSGRVTDEGYQVEMAIPFKSLRFPNSSEQNWRVTFIRSHPRSSVAYYEWAATDRDDPCYPCQFGSLTGIEGVTPGTAIEILPSFVGSWSKGLSDPSDPRSGLGDVRDDFDGSMGIRYGLRSSGSAELTINPDFSQVESDADQIDVNTTFALYFPERRPFFQEGSDLYETPYRAIYTRMINDPDVAGKLSGRSASEAGVFLVARDENSPIVIPMEEEDRVLAVGRSLSIVARAQRTFGEENFLGGLLTYRKYDIGGSGSVWGIDGRYRIARNWLLEAQGLLSHTGEADRNPLTDPDSSADFSLLTFARGLHTARLDGESFGGSAAYLAIKREARHLNLSLDIWDTSPTFVAANGFVSRNNELRTEWSGSYTFYPDNSWLDRVRPNAKVTRRLNGYDEWRALAVENWVDFVFKRQTRALIGYDLYSERFRGVYFQQMPLYYGEVSVGFGDVLTIGGWVGVGDRVDRRASPVLGSGLHVDAWMKLKLWNRLVVEPVLARSDLKDKDTDEEFFAGYILRTRVNYQFTREMFLRLVAQQNDFEGTFTVEPLLSYKLNPFSVFYIGASQNRLDLNFDSATTDRTNYRLQEWQLFFKFQYFYRI